MKATKENLDRVKIDIVLNYFKEQNKSIKYKGDIKIKPFTEEENEMLDIIRKYKKKIDAKASKNDNFNKKSSYDLVKSIDNFEKKKGKV